MPFSHKSQMPPQEARRPQMCRNLKATHDGGGPTCPCFLYNTILGLRGFTVVEFLHILYEYTDTVWRLPN